LSVDIERATYRRTGVQDDSIMPYAEEDVRMMITASGDQTGGRLHLPIGETEGIRD
jgi:hypothetical protein